MTNDGITHLLEQAKSGDRRAFGELMERHYHLLRRTAYRILKNTADAEDIAQEVSLKVLCKLHTFKSESTFSTWLIRIAINESLLFLRKSRRMALFHIDEVPDCETPRAQLTANTPCPERQYLANDELTRLHRGIARLPSNLRGVLSDQVFSDLSLIEVAKRQGLSVAAVKGRTHRARRKLSRALEMRRGAVRESV